MFAVLTFTVLQLSDPASMTVDEIEHRALDARRAIKSIHICFRITNGGVRDGNWKEITRVYEVWRDDSHLRTDYVAEGIPDRKTGVGHREVECYNCERPRHQVSYVQGLTPADVVAPGHPNFGRGFVRTFDPRLIGYVVRSHVSLTGLKPTHQLETDINSPNIGPRRQERGELNGEPAIVLRSKWKKPVLDYAVWVLPGKGYSVGRIEFERTNEQKQLIKVRNDSELILDKPSGLWFPRKCVMETTYDGKLESRETIEVQSVRLNQKIDPTVFTLAGMRILNGSSVFFPETGNKAENLKVWWDGKPIPASQQPKGPPGTAPKTNPPPVAHAPRPVDPDAVSGGFRWWYLAAAGVFSAAAVVLFRWALIRRSA